MKCFENNKLTIYLYLKYKFINYFIKIFLFNINFSFLRLVNNI